MLGFMRKKSAQDHATGTLSEDARPGIDLPPLSDPDEDMGATLIEGLRHLEIATLALDAIAHALKEARVLARIAARRDGRAQRHLLARRYAWLCDEVEHRLQEATLRDGEVIARVMGATRAPKPARVLPLDLPHTDFIAAEDAKAVIRAVGEALQLIEAEAALFRNAAGEIADNLVHFSAERAPAPRQQAPAAVPQSRIVQRGRRAA